MMSDACEGDTVDMMSDACEGDTVDMVTSDVCGGDACNHDQCWM